MEKMQARLMISQREATWLLFRRRLPLLKIPHGQASNVPSYFEEPPNLYGRQDGRSYTTGTLCLPHKVCLNAQQIFGQNGILTDLHGWPVKTVLSPYLRRPRVYIGMISQWPLSFEYLQPGQER